MTVAVHNPSSIDLKSLKIAVPHGNFKVQTFCPYQKKFVDANAVVFCSQEAYPVGATCDMHISNHTTLPGFFSLV